ncbi:MAG: hypothetical protein EBS41_00185 [Actinobacteria bacterium]|nr:hypothetical protein [Actinomycetota bacterium]
MEEADSPSGMRPTASNVAAPVSGSAQEPTAAEKLTAALAAIDLTPDTTTDERIPPALPQTESLLDEVPPHHVPRA